MKTFRTIRRLPILALPVLLLVSAVLTYAQVGGAFDLSWSTVDGGGGTFSTGGSYSLGGTSGQPDAGVMSGGGFTVAGGFWGYGAGSSPTSTSTPTSTPTATRTPTNTSTATPTTANVLVGHVTWQGRPAQPNALQQLPITLTLKSGAIEVNYPMQTTSAGGYFTISTGLPNGTYQWRAKGPSGTSPITDTNSTPGFLAITGTLTLTGALLTNVEIGTMRAGDCNNDNLVTSADFIILKNTFGKAIGQVGYDNRADFTGDTVITSVDFTLLKSNFGFGGALPVGPR
jgi:hypothetical protein